MPPPVLHKILSPLPEGTVGNNETVPVFGCSLNYALPNGTILHDLVVTTAAVYINGVDVYKYLEAVNPRISPDQVRFGFPLWGGGEYVIHLAHGVNQFTVGFIYTGKSWRFRSTYRGPIPLVNSPYRIHEGAFLSPQAQLQRMDPVWSQNHEDADVIATMVARIGEFSWDKLLLQTQVRNGLYAEWVEPVDRVRCAVVTLDGAIAQVPYVDIQVLYDLLTKKSYRYARDFFINKSGQLVFLAQDCPGRVKAAAVTVSGKLQNVTPPTSGFDSFAQMTLVGASDDDSAVFAGADIATLTGVDFFFMPPGRLASGPPPSVTGALTGKVTLLTPDGTAYTLFDDRVAPAAFSGAVTFNQPISLRRGQFLRIVHVGLNTNSLFDVSLSIWLRRKAILIGPDAHIQSNRLSRLWAPLAGIEEVEEALLGKLKMAALIKARTEKSASSFVSVMETQLGVPVAPFNGVVGQIVEPSQFCPGQIDIFGAVQEFSESVDFAVKPGDEVTFLQSLLKPSDGVTIDDAQTDPHFLEFSLTGVPPATDPFCVDYVRSKIVGAVAVPAAFDTTPGASDFYRASLFLRDTSFRINLGEYASLRFLTIPGFDQRIFQVIDAVKPSGSDYWIRLSDGRAIVRGTPTDAVVNVSSRLGLSSDYGHRIYEDEAFATGQCVPRYIGFASGVPALGDTYRIDFPVTADFFIETITAADAADNVLFPADATFKRLRDAINASALNASITAEFVEGSALSAYKLRLVPVPLQADFVKFTGAWTVFATKTASPLGSTAVLTPALASSVVPGDISRIFQTKLFAQQTMNDYQEAAITLVPLDPAGTAAISDYGAGPFDDTAIPITAPVTTESVDIATRHVGRLTVRGYAGLSMPAGTPPTSVFLGYSAQNGFTTGDTLHIDVTAVGPLYTLSRVMLDSDLDLASVLAGLGGDLAKDIRFAQLFEVRYPDPATVPAGGPYYIELVPRTPQDPAYATYIITLYTTTFAASPILEIFGIAGNSSGVSVTDSPNYMNLMSLTAAFAYPDPLIALTASQNVTFSDSIFGKQAGKLTRLDMRIVFEPHQVPTPFLQVNLAITFDVIASGVGVDPVMNLYSAQCIINDYPEFSHDDDAVIFQDFRTHLQATGTFAYGDTEDPCVFVPAPPLLLFQDASDTTLDVTARILAPTEETISDVLIDEGVSQVYFDGVYPAAALSVHSASQFVCSPPGVESPIKFLPLSARVFAKTGKVDKISVIDSGGGYATPPTVIITGANTILATATPVMIGAVDSVYKISVTFGGTGYLTPPAISIVGANTTPATAVAAITAGVVTSVTVTFGGTGYLTTPAVVFASGTAFAVASLGKAVGSVEVTSGGTGYLATPAISFFPGPATGSATIADTVIELTPAVDFTEAAAPQPGSITITAASAAVNASRLFGFVRATKWNRYYQGPYARTMTISSSMRGAFGIRDQYLGVPVNAAGVTSLAPSVAGATYPISVLKYSPGGGDPTILNVPAYGLEVDEAVPYTPNSTNLSAWDGVTLTSLTQGVHYSENAAAGQIILSVAVAGPHVGAIAIVGVYQSDAILAKRGYAIDEDSMAFTDNIKVTRGS